MLTALLAYYIIFFAIAFVWPTWRLWRCERISALVLPSNDTAEGVIGLWFKGLISSVALVVTAFSLGLPLQTVGELTWIAAAPVAVIGWALLIGSLVWVALSQSHMGRAWRIGIDHANTPLLARGGLFRWSRNPIFLGLRLNLAGLFLLLPNAATFAILLVGEAMMQVQVRLEERHLASVFGDAYADYHRSVRRWL